MAGRGYSKKDLEALGKEWDSAEDADMEIADGDFHMLIEESRLQMEAGKRRQVVTKVKVVAGDDDYVGNVLTMYDGCESEVNIGYLKKKLSRAGIRLGKGAKGLLKAIEEFVGRVVEVRIKNKDGFCNWYVNGLISADGAAEADDDDDADDDLDDKDDDVAVAGKDDEDEDEDDEKDEGKPSRTLLEQDDVADMAEGKCKTYLDKNFDGLDTDKIAKGHKKEVLQYLIAIVEGDAFEPDEEDTPRYAAKAFGLRVKKSMDDEAIEDLVQGKLEEIFS